MGVITARDERLMSWVGRFAALNLSLVQTWISDIDDGGVTPSIAYARLKVLQDVGFIESERIFVDMGRVFWLSSAGCGYLGLGIPGGRPRITHLRHDMYVAALATEIRRTKSGHELITEREIRRDEFSSSDDEMLISSRQMVGSKMQRVYPDLVSVAPSGARVVHEVETAIKDKKRLVRLMTSHLVNHQISAARYYGYEEFLPRLNEAAEIARREASLINPGPRVSVHRLEVSW